MDQTIVNELKAFSLFGVSKSLEQNQSYGDAIRELLDLVWKEVRDNDLSHTGINHVVYEADNYIFAGIELLSPLNAASGLEKKEVIFQKYFYWKHVGPYHELGDAYGQIHSNIKALGEQYTHPLLEIYGHWNEDQSKLETEILYTIK